MFDYSEIYEILRKEKYSEQLQKLDKNFLKEVSEYFNVKKEEFSVFSDEFSDSVLRARKQFENSKAIFKELILRRKKKILDLVFIAAETGVMKKDFANMLDFEVELFEKFVKAIEESEKKLADQMNGKEEVAIENKAIILNEDVEQMVGMAGESVGPFKKGELANLNSKVAEILVSGGKARFVDD